MPLLRRRRRSFLILLLLLLLSLLYYTGIISFPSPSSSEPTKHLVIARLSSNDISWIPTYLSDYTYTAYTMDKPSSSPSIPKNKGREGMAYLTYIITNYYKLPDVVVFIHGERYQWHNDDPVYDQVNVLRRLQAGWVVERGYANLRCSWSLGCPRVVLPNYKPPPLNPNDRDKEEEGHPADEHYASAYRTLLNLPADAYVPSHIGAGCCAQFAVSRSQIHLRSIEDYTRMRHWLLTTPLSDMTAGRILEYTWHVIFGRPGVYCPVAERCYCDVFGLCSKGYSGEKDELGREVEEEEGKRVIECTVGDCKVDGEWVYTMPRSRVVPVGWPDVGEKEKEGWMFGEEGRKGDVREKELEGKKTGKGGA